MFSLPLRFVRFEDAEEGAGAGGAPLTVDVTEVVLRWEVDAGA